jgi:hypothetical protein
MILSLVLLLASAQRVVLVDELIRVPASQWQAVDFALNQRPATIECQFRVERGSSGVRVVLLDRREARRFRAREPHRVILSTGFQKSGEFRYNSGIGDYSLVIDNRLEGRGPAEVRLELALSFGGQALPHVQELSSARRAVVILISLLLFAALVWPALRHLHRAAKNRGQPACSPKCPGDT